MNRPLYQDRGPLLGNTVAMTNKDVLTIEVVNGTVTGSLIRLLVAFKEEVTTAIAHVNALAVQIRSINSLTATLSGQQGH